MQGGGGAGDAVPYIHITCSKDLTKVSTKGTPKRPLCLSGMSIKPLAGPTVIGVSFPLRITKTPHPKIKITRIHHVFYRSFIQKCEGRNVSKTPQSPIYKAIYRGPITPFITGRGPSVIVNQPTLNPTNPSNARCAKHHFSCCAALNLMEVISIPQLGGICHTCTSPKTSRIPRASDDLSWEFKGPAPANATFIPTK